ncbi:small integral membrane protein 24 isoform X2 [Cynoglossus semilaevis]|uniref:small integral membrane protein 24 isoform X2 n=1 Tax=Cynoglossus semilaevis TaxID=244447 RepID=UPI0004970EB3|nr:small integral membrane protein 24 isoform X2 [Cynoglossus semilaevis]
MDVSRFLLCVCVCLLSVNSCSAGKDVHRGLKVSTGSRSVTLQPWLVGLTAVVGFLFIVFIIVIVKRLLRKNRDEWDYDRTVDSNRAGDDKQTSL